MELSRLRQQKGNKYLSFELAKEVYCLEIELVREILGMAEITAVPQTPDFIRGVMNLRGNILPLIDLRLRFGLPFKAYNDRTCILVVENGTKDGLLGLIVDTIHEVINPGEGKLTQLPYINSRVKSEYIQGFIELDTQLAILLNISKILNETNFYMTSPESDLKAEGRNQ